MFEKTSFKVITVVLAVIALISTSFYFGQEYGSNKKENEWINKESARIESEKKTEEKIEKKAEQSDTVIEEIEKDTINSSKNISEKTQTIEKEVIKYVTKNINDCADDNDAEFLRIYNSAESISETEDKSKWIIFTRVWHIIR